MQIVVILDQKHSITLSNASSSSHPETSLDGDNPEHIQWVFERAQERAAEFNITGITYRLTQGESVVKKKKKIYSVLMRFFMKVKVYN